MCFCATPNSTLLLSDVIYSASGATFYLDPACTQAPLLPLHLYPGLPDVWTELDLTHSNDKVTWVTVVSVNWTQYSALMEDSHPGEDEFNSRQIFGHLVRKTNYTFTTTSHPIPDLYSTSCKKCQKSLLVLHHFTLLLPVPGKFCKTFQTEPVHCPPSLQSCSLRHAYWLLQRLFRNVILHVCVAVVVLSGFVFQCFTPFPSPLCSSGPFYLSGRHYK